MTKKILVTGSSGFIGSHVADNLEKQGHNIILFDSVPSKFKTKNQKEFIGDILNQNDIDNAIDGCDMVYHFAAQADIGASSNSPKETMLGNIIGTQNVLESAKNKGLSRILFASTIYVYSELGSFYRVSKQACEKMIEEYQREFSINYTILRFGSLYGPRANQFNGIRNFLYQAIKNNKIIRRGDGEEIREYIHVNDAAKLSVDALDEKFVNKHLIITGNQQIKIKDLLLMIKEMLLGEVEIEFGKEDELNHYKITPYNFKPQIAEKITPKSYYDLGQGLLDQIYDIEEEIADKENSKNVSLRPRKK
ncbi:NAD(P)-dependent oxidoreductase [Candidatus Marinimicrobia bacterium]|nr:NAD(P)-dependent oxidoreductase [Candidatus Neomarinimicrobiota bacterium]